MARLAEREIDARLAASPWHRDGDAIVRDYELADFAAAMRLVADVGRLAEEANHHPDILVHDYKHVRLTCSTHSQGGITDSDLDLAARIDELG